MLSFALLQVFMVTLLVAANAFFVAAEFALVSVRDTRIEQCLDGLDRAEHAERAIEATAVRHGIEV